MKKLESTWYNMAIVLTLISVISGGVLAYVNKQTAPAIQKVKEQQLNDGLKAVLGASELTIEQQDTLKDDQKGDAIVYRTDKGVAVQTTDPKGFGGKLTVLVGLGDGGEILGYRVMETSETPGLGAKADTWFQKGAKGDIIGKTAGSLSVTKDNGDVDAITASTITSRAFLRAVNDAASRLNGSADAQSGATQQNH